MSTTQNERLRALLEPLVVTAGLDLEEIKLSAAGRRRQLLVVVDSDDGVDLDAMAEVSRDISQALDASDAMGDAEYLLEVSSPGTDRPLTEPRHFRRNTGRLVRFHLEERGELIARIMTVDDTGLDLQVPGVKGRKPKPARADFGEIARARVEVEFNRGAGGAGDRVQDDGGDAPHERGHGDPHAGGHQGPHDGSTDESTREA